MLFRICCHPLARMPWLQTATTDRRETSPIFPGRRYQRDLESSRLDVSSCLSSRVQFNRGSTSKSPILSLELFQHFCTDLRIIPPAAEPMKPQVSTMNIQAETKSR